MPVGRTPDGGDAGTADELVVTVINELPLLLGTVGVKSTELSKGIRSSSSPQIRWVDASLPLPQLLCAGSRRLLGLRCFCSASRVLRHGVKASMLLS